MIRLLRPRSRERKLTPRPPLDRQHKRQSVAYLVHNVADAAVRRRIETLHAAGISLTIIGFRRSADVIREIDGSPVIDLGTTRDGRLVQRVAALASVLVRFRTIRDSITHCDIVIARNLEMLVLGARAAAGRRLIYECLDIHSSLLRGGPISKALSSVEKFLIQKTNLIITSSPRFARDYFQLVQKVRTPIFLAENKLPARLAPQHKGAVDASTSPSGPPWVIGWFGMLRCQKSLRMLAAIASASMGRIEIVIAGIPSEAEFASFSEMVDAMPGIRYIGPYRSEDLSRLYRTVHFAWAIDYFEEGFNSSWLLPNRLYESLAYDAIPIALASVETGQWMTRHNVGLVINDPPAQLGRILDELTRSQYDDLQTAVKDLPRSEIIATAADNGALVAAIIGGPQK